MIEHVCSATSYMLRYTPNHALHLSHDMRDMRFPTRLYEDCSNMNASSFMTLFIYKLRHNGKRFYEGLYVTFKLAPDLKKIQYTYRVIALRMRVSLVY